MTLVDQPQTLDLLTLRDDVTAVLGDQDLAPGTYDGLRLIVDAASVVVDGETAPLTIPSGGQTGVKIDLALDVAADTVYAIVLDFDAGASVHRTGHGDWMMSPVVHVAYVGTVGPDGTVTPIGEPADEPAADGGVAPEPDPEPAPDAGAGGVD